MGNKNRFIGCPKGMETLTAVFMLLIMFASITGVIVAFFNYNLSTQEQMSIDQARSQETIMLSKDVEAGTSRVSNIIVTNNGTIEVKIRAVYIDDDGKTAFFDPSLDMDTFIKPGNSITISLEDPPFKEARIIAATERGTTSIDSPPAMPKPQPPPPPDTNEFYIGPLRLKFDNFWFQSFKASFDPNNPWTTGWVVENSPGEYCAWKITVTNVGDQDITINGFSSLTTFPSDSTDYRSWFLWTQAQPSSPNLKPLLVNEKTDIIFVRPAADKDGYRSIYSGGCTCMVFLTFFGKYADQTPYAQTIPFEAAITVV